eukprot:5795048-Pyramimonas_sp.AAC.1
MFPLLSRCCCPHDSFGTPSTQTVPQRVQTTAPVGVCAQRRPAGAPLKPIVAQRDLQLLPKCGCANSVAQPVRHNPHTDRAS